MERDDARDRLIMAMSDVLHALADGHEYGPAMRENIHGFQRELCEAAPHLEGRPRVSTSPEKRTAQTGERKK